MFETLFMGRAFFCVFLQSFPNLVERPLLVDLTVEEGQRLKVIYGSSTGFHAIDLDNSEVFDIYIPTHVSLWRYIGLCSIEIHIKGRQLWSYL